MELCQAELCAEVDELRRLNQQVTVFVLVLALVIDVSVSASVTVGVIELR